MVIYTEAGESDSSGENKVALTFIKDKKIRKNQVNTLSKCFSRLPGSDKSSETKEYIWERKE